jgi:hypothetical protein
LYRVSADGAFTPASLAPIQPPETAPFFDNPTHDAEAANEVHAGDLKPVIRKVGIFLPSLRILVPGEVKIANLRGGRLGCGSNESHAGRAEGVTRNVRLGDKQVGRWIMQQVLRCIAILLIKNTGRLRSSAASGIIEPNRNPAIFRECVDRLPIRPSEASVRARSARRRFGDYGTCGAGAGMLPGRHESMVANAGQR